jgi:acyl-CoA-binding protein
MEETEQSFNYCVKKIKSETKKISNEDKLYFYAHYKQATVGPCSESDVKKPSIIDITAKAKWDAWNKLGDMDKEEAMENYCIKYMECF